MDKVRAITFELPTDYELRWQEEFIFSIPGCVIAKTYSQMEKNGTRSTACIVEQQGMQVEASVSWSEPQQCYCFSVATFKPAENGELFDLIEHRCRALGLNEVTGKSKMSG